MADTFGEAVRELRVSRGWSQRRLAAEARYSKPAISFVETGYRQPTEELARACDRALDTGGLLIDLFVATQRGNDMLRRLLLRGLATLPTAGLLAPAAVAEAVRQQVQAALGGERGWDEVIADHARGFVQDPLADFARTVGADLMLLSEQLDDPAAVRATAYLSMFYGSVTGSLSGDPTAGRRWYRTAVLAANSQPDVAVRGWVQARLAIRLAYEGGTPAEILTAADAAVAVLRRPSSALAEAHAGRAHAVARLGDTRAARAALDAAWAARDAAGAQESLSMLSMPPWRLAVADSYVLTALGDLDGATDAHAEVRRGLPPEADRWRVQLEMHSAWNQIQHGDVDGGCARAAEVLRARRGMVVTSLGRELLGAVPEPERRRAAVADLGAAVSGSVTPL